MKEKSVDESWKETAAESKEVEENQEETVDQTSQNPGEIEFLNYATSLGFQAMIFLGEIPNPISGEQEKNLDQAKMIIDTLAMLREKTKGNLTQKEEDFLNTTVYELQMKFVELSQAENKE